MRISKRVPGVLIALLLSVTAGLAPAPAQAVSAGVGVAAVADDPEDLDPRGRWA